MWRRASLIAAFTSLALLPGPVFAWNSVGHMVVSKLAYDRLEDSHKKKLFILLQSHPHFQRYLVAGRPDDISEVEWVIVRSSVWPDWVRPRSANDPRGDEVTRYHRAEDHYVNVPFVHPRDEAVFAGKTLIDPDVTNILDALKQRCNEVRTKTTADRDKAIAVCWIFHLVGDIHQPLHNVAFFKDTNAFRKGDLGGNLFGVRAGGVGIKLHAYWDNLLGDDPNYADDSANHQARIYREALKIADNLRGLQLAEAEQSKLANNTSFQNWSQESVELAKNAGYRTGDGKILSGAPVPFKGPIPESAPELGDEYMRAARAVAEVRIMLAGHRLADRLKRVLGK
jgi:hypothetical protein